MTGMQDPSTRLALRLVTGALCVAALAAIVAILSGDFSEGDLKVMGTSVLFAIATSTGAAGAGLRQRGGDVAAGLGTIVAIASAATFAFVTYGMWVEVDAEDFWRMSWSLAIVALDGALACVVLARRRASDSEAVALATAIAVLAAAISGTIGIIAAVGLAEDGPWQVLAVVLVVQVLATVLAPVLRRLGGQQLRPAAAASHSAAEGDLGSELIAIADELDAAESSAAVRVLADRLRQVARDSPPPPLSARRAGSLRS